MTLPAPKKRRAARRVSVLFASIEKGTKFWLPGRKTELTKTSPLTASAGSKDGWFFVNPFRSVFASPLIPGRDETLLERISRGECEQLQEKVEEVITGRSPFPGLLEAKPFPAGAANEGRTHFVGDDCPGGHADVPVNNDNNITGPTS